MNDQSKTFSEETKEPEEKLTQKEDIFWLEQKETQNGTKMLSVKLNGKHYVGWWFNKENKREDGTAYQTDRRLLTFNKGKEIAKMRLCNWEGCQICHPNQIII